MSRYNGKALRRARLDLGVSQASLALIAGVEQTQISQWERGTEPTGRNLVKLVDALRHVAEKAGRRPESYDITMFYGGA